MPTVCVVDRFVPKHRATFLDYLVLLSSCTTKILIKSIRYGCSGGRGGRRKGVEMLNTKSGGFVVLAPLFRLIKKHDSGQSCVVTS